MSSTLSNLLLTALLCVASVNTAFASAYTAKGVVQGNVHLQSNQSPWLGTWLEASQQSGTGLLRHDDGLTILLEDAYVDFNADISNSLTLSTTLNYSQDGRDNVGVTEAYFHYSPLGKQLKNDIKVGYFYPQFSLENSDTAWLSPYTFNFSAINSWIGEEVRPLGFEWQISRPGRRIRSPHSYTLTLSAYQQNDGLASLLSWRGWAIHNRQSAIGEKIDFADYFQFMPVEAPNPTYVDINKETDGRVGFYLGGHYQYLRQTDARLYYYDNQASPFGLEPDRQYSWRTKFVSLALLHKFSKTTRLLSQYMNGSTEMGDNINGVHNDFQAWYVMLNHSANSHRLSMRYDKFAVSDKDLTPFDPNESSGYSITVSWRKVLNRHWHLGAEAVYLKSTNLNRTLWREWTSTQKQHSLSLVIQYRF